MQIICPSCSTEYNIAMTIPGMRSGILVCSNCLKEIKITKSQIEDNIIVTAILRNEPMPEPVIKVSLYRRVINFIKSIHYG